MTDESCSDMKRRQEDWVLDTYLGHARPLTPSFSHRNVMRNEVLRNI